MATGFPSASIRIVTQSPPPGLLNVGYSYFLDAVDFDLAPLTWSVSLGALPPGLALNAGTGEISGTPTTVGVFNFTISAVDAVLKTGTQVMSMEIAPQLGTVARYQQRTVDREAALVPPREGWPNPGFNLLRRKLERLLFRTDGAQITEPYFLDAADLQIRNFNATPFQSVDDALNVLLGLITGFVSGADDTTGLPLVVPDGNGALNFFGLAPITVTKNIGLNRIEIGFTGAPLSAPFTMLPAPSGDVTGVTDTANLVALFAGAHQDWLVSPQDESDAPYYINADILSVAHPRLYRLSGKTSRAFRMVGVGGVLRTFFAIRAVENANFTDVVCTGTNVSRRTLYTDVVTQHNAGVALFIPDHRVRMERCAVDVGSNVGSVFSAPTEFHARNCLFTRSVGDALSRLGNTTFAGPSLVHISDCQFLPQATVGQVALDFSSAQDPGTAIILGANIFYNASTATPIARGTTPVVLAGQYAEAVQALTDLAVVPGF